MRRQTTCGTGYSLLVFPNVCQIDALVHLIWRAETARHTSRLCVPSNDSFDSFIRVNRPNTHTRKQAKENKLDTPEDLLSTLKEGNRRFMTETSIHPRRDAEARIDTHTSGQNPFVGILSCSDSRAPVEIIFDQGIGDIFSIRNAGNICDDTVIGSFELAVTKFDISLLIVMGHTDCGAVKLALKEETLPGHMSRIIGKIQPAVNKVKETKQDIDGKHLEFEVALQNAIRAASELTQGSRILAERIDSGKLMIVPAMYYLEDGAVEWSGE